MTFIVWLHPSSFKVNQHVKYMVKDSFTQTLLSSLTRRHIQPTDCSIRTTKMFHAQQPRPTCTWCLEWCVITMWAVFRCLVCGMYVQVSHQLALHVACSRPGPGTLQIVQQILRWSSKDIRLTADRVTTIIVLCSCNKIIAKSKLLNYVNSCWSSI